MTVIVVGSIGTDDPDLGLSVEDRHHHQNNRLLAHELCPHWHDSRNSYSVHVINEPEGRL